MTSNRLRIRRMEFRDAAFIIELLNEPAFFEHIGDRGVRTTDDAERYMLEGPMSSHKDHGFGLDLVELTSGPDSVPVGIAGLLQRPYFDKPDIGYAILRRHRRNGIGREACELVLQNAGKLGITEVLAIVSPGNGASIALLEKLDFEFDNHIEIPGSEKSAQLFSRTQMSQD
jgi:RimJ/RimL family protein N-acetyltransferase